MWKKRGKSVQDGFRVCYLLSHPFRIGSVGNKNASLLLLADNSLSSKTGVLIILGLRKMQDGKVLAIIPLRQRGIRRNKVFLSIEHDKSQKIDAILVKHLASSLAFRIALIANKKSFKIRSQKYNATAL